jgi:glycosyltransferase involved in cell wall biosynthesis
LKTLYFTVTNNLVYDQRMIRICESLRSAGYRVVLVGRTDRLSPPLLPRHFEQKRLSCHFKKGFLFYAEYNLKLFFYLIPRSMNLICAIDLDTIVPCFFISWLKRIPRVYDAHELFCEMKEVVSRPRIYRFWKMIERIFVPRFPHGYTVSQPIADIFKQEYGVSYGLVRNLPRSKTLPADYQPGNFILYQGAVNEGRCFETLIPAMKQVDFPLHIYGDGNFLEQTRAMIRQYQLEDKVLLKGKHTPEELFAVTCRARVGITLFEDRGLSNRYSLANRFFDYIQAGLPQICSNLPAYRTINDPAPVALLIDEPSPENIAGELNKLLRDQVLYNKLRENCLRVRNVLNWENEEQKLIACYQEILK